MNWLSHSSGLTDWRDEARALLTSAFVAGRFRYAGAGSSLRLRRRERALAIYHLTMKPMARSSGRWVIGSIAYRSGENLTNLRDGVIHDYSRRNGVEGATLVLPGDRAESR